ncbi:uncharacterized protein TNCT_392751, partial [Trichonephila clavata]
YGCDPVNVTMFMTPEQDISYNDMRPRTDYINWNAVIWVDRPLTLWIFQAHEYSSVMSWKSILVSTTLSIKGLKQLCHFSEDCRFTNTPGRVVPARKMFISSSSYIMQLA